MKIGDTLFWSASAAVFVFRLATKRPEHGLWRRATAGTIGALAVAEVVTSRFTFSFWTEFAMLPVLAVVVLLGVVAERDPEHASVGRFTGWFTGMAGLAVLSQAASAAMHEMSTTLLVELARTATLVPALSVMLVPFAAALLLWLAYMDVFDRMTCSWRGPTKKPDVLAYGRRRAVRYAGLSAVRARRLVREYPLALMEARSRREMDELFARASSA